MLNDEQLETLRLSGRISATAREHGRTLIVPGAKLREIAEAVEAVIFDMGGELAFPAQLSRNHIAAHYCSGPDDETEVEPDDIVKLDLGAHVDGYVTDNAITVDLRDGPESKLVEASAKALDAAIERMGPGASIARIGGAIERTIQSYGFNPIYDLSGHGVARYLVHCAPSIPNFRDQSAPKLKPGQTIACEPFACTGRGRIQHAPGPEVFGLRRVPTAHDDLRPDFVAAARATKRLPFARRGLLAHLPDLAAVEAALTAYSDAGLLVSYPPLVERRGVRVSQTEHTIYIHEDRAEVLTRL
jgi:methionyl aminopeptidase